MGRSALLDVDVADEGVAVVEGVLEELTLRGDAVEGDRSVAQVGHHLGPQPTLADAVVDGEDEVVRRTDVVLDGLDVDGTAAREVQTGDLLVQRVGGHVLNLLSDPRGVSLSAGFCRDLPLRDKSNYTNKTE